MNITKHNQITICFSCDNNYVQHMYITIMSILKFAKNSEFYNIYILNGGISQKNINILNKLKNENTVNINFIDINANDFSACPMTNYVSYITLPTYYRFKIASLIPDIDKILYLDSDIVVNNNIAELYNTDIESYYIAAVPEVNNHHHKERLSLNDNQYYINAGVLLINIKKWNEDNIEKKLFDYIKHPIHEIIYQDQDVLNDVLKNNIKYIDLSWNLQHDAIDDEYSYLYHSGQRLDALKNPKLIHFTHKLKPWHSKCKNKYRFLYYSFLKKSPWKHKLLDICIKNFFFTFLRFIYQHQKLNEGSLKITKIFGLPVCKKVRKDGTKYIYILGINIFNKKTIKDKNFLQKIFSVKKIDDYRKVMTILGIKIKFKTFYNFFDVLRHIIREEVSSACAREIYSALCVANTHSKTFPQYKNKHNGESIAIFGCGPSLKYCNKGLKNTINIALNKALFLNTFNSHYHFALDGNMRFVENDYIEKLKNYNCDKFIGYFLEPLRHYQFHQFSKFENSDFKIFYSANRSLIPGQEFENKIYPELSIYPLADFYSVSFPALHFALYTNPKKIYLIGLDTSNNGHLFYDKISEKNYLFDKMIEGYKLFKEFQENHYPNTEIISVNPIGLKGLFKDVYTQSYVDSHKELLNENIEIINEEEVYA